MVSQHVLQDGWTPVIFTASAARYQEFDDLRRPEDVAKCRKQLGSEGKITIWRVCIYIYLYDKNTVHNNILCIVMYYTYIYIHNVSIDIRYQIIWYSMIICSRHVNAKYSIYTVYSFQVWGFHPANMAMWWLVRYWLALADIFEENQNVEKPRTSWLVTKPKESERSPETSSF